MQGVIILSKLLGDVLFHVATQQYMSLYLYKNSIQPNQLEISNYSTFSIFIRNSKVPFGTILKRPLDYKPLAKIISHHGVVIGTDIDGKYRIAEITKDNNIRLSTVKQFLSTYREEDIEFVSFPNTELKISDVFSRIYRIINYQYNIADLNCISFAQYLVFNSSPHWGSEFLLKINEFNQAINRLQLANQNSGNYVQFLKNEIKKVEFQSTIITAKLIKSQAHLQFAQCNRYKPKLQK
ncbi:MAG: hypothetical protein O3A55_07905, partial [Bacteroidetes bacterium]|nr:hypothetical protein [Bacteroidota bacterium]